MAFIVVSRAPNRETYERVTALIDTSGRPEGSVIHAASELEDGTVEIVDVWESEADMERFEQAQLMPAFAEAGILEMVKAQGRPVGHEPFDFRT